MKKVNLGCGDFHLEGYINVDIREKVKPDVVADILKGLPFDSRTIDEVTCSEFLEHFTPEEVVMVIKEINTILKYGGIFEFGLPDGIKCASLLGHHYWENQRREDVEYLWNNVNGQRNRAEGYKENQDEINARSHKNLFNEQYLTLLLEKYGFKDIKFGQHMKAYDKWKEPYKLIGTAIKC